MKRIFQKLDEVITRVLWRVMTGSNKCSKDCVLNGLRKKEAK